MKALKAYDSNDDGWISINEFLHASESTGDGEKVDKGTEYDYLTMHKVTLILSSYWRSSNEPNRRSTM